jgi:hypothetical protein
VKVIALFDDADAARAACQRFGGEMYSCEPIAPPPVPSNILAATVLGGIAGGAGGFALAALTATSMHLVTGAMPIVALAPTGIITFALAALGAIGAALATLLWQAGLLTTTLALPDDVRREVAEGAVAVVADVSPAEFAASGARTTLPG